MRLYTSAARARLNTTGSGRQIEVFTLVPRHSRYILVADRQAFWTVIWGDILMGALAVFTPKYLDVRQLCMYILFPEAITGPKIRRVQTSKIGIWQKKTKVYVVTPFVITSVRELPRLPTQAPCAPHFLKYLQITSTPFSTLK